MSCNDCIHYGICLFHHTDEEYKKCVHFKPSADVVEVRHGEWKICSDGYYPFCSKCGVEPQSGTMTRFCPDCGAKMDGERREQG